MTSTGPQPFAAALADQPSEGEGDLESGNLTWKTLISGDRTPSAEMVLGVAVFPPGGHLNLHRHAPAEFYFGLTGDGIVHANGAALRIAKDVALFIPGNTEHGVTAGDDGLSFVYGFATQAFSDVIYRFSANPHDGHAIGSALAAARIDSQGHERGDHQGNRKAPEDEA